MSVHIDSFGLTDVGRHRHTNEDQFLVADLQKSVLVHQTSLEVDDHTRLTGGPRGHLYLVADGMGGTAGGAVASRVTVDALTRYILTTLPWFFRLRTDEEADLSEELVNAVGACERAVREAAAADPNPARGNMGTTLTLAYVLWPRLYVVHAGDSRAYLRRDGHLHQLTRDHTVAEKMVAAGQMTRSMADVSRWSHVLTNVIGGGGPAVAPEVHRVTLHPGDALLLCTDGVTNELDDPRLNELLEADSAEASVRAIVTEAVRAGGRDNTTAVVARFVPKAGTGTGTAVALG